MGRVKPADDIARVAEAQQRFNTAIVGLSDADVRRATNLPGWTVGHVLTHVARNADSHRRRTEAAAKNEMIDQYSGGYEGRDAEIESGAGRTAAELIDDVRVSGEEMVAAWRAAPDSAWTNMTRDVGGRERPLAELILRRWQELEVHVVDLDVGITYRDWPDDFVAAWLPRLRGFFPDRPETPAGLDERDELAWLYGRLQRNDLPVLPAWG
jgi:maleylpyruvate isomerase